MAKKEFTYRGLTAEALSKLGIKEFARLIPSRERRTLLRGMTKEQQSLLAKLAKRDKVKSHAREMVIVPQMIGKTVSLHNGKDYIPVAITEEMVGHRIGEFALTKRFARHSSPGVGGKGKGKVKVK